MPIYEYKCLKCGHQFEKMQNISDDAVRRCEKCGEQVTRLFHPVAVHFKGSGFYSTDYGKGSTRKDRERAENAREPGSGKGEGKQGSKQGKQGGKQGGGKGGGRQRKKSAGSA